MRSITSDAVPQSRKPAFARFSERIRAAGLLQSVSLGLRADAEIFAGEVLLAAKGQHRLDGAVTAPVLGVGAFDQTKSKIDGKGFLVTANDAASPGGAKGGADFAYCSTSPAAYAHALASFPVKFGLPPTVNDATIVMWQLPSFVLVAASSLAA